MHIALLGDSTFDNRLYTEGGPDVAAHLERLLGPTGHATLLAVDGAVVASVYAQIETLRGMLHDEGAGDPPTHLALSVGGNDLLGEIDVLRAPARSVGEALLAVRERSERFGESYRALLDEALGLGLPTVICTVYQGDFEDPVEAAVIDTALRIFDHHILAAGIDRDLPVVDLRRVCTEPADYWNPIEPSDAGGLKIAGAVLRAFRAPRYDVGGAVTWQGTAGATAPTSD